MTARSLSLPQARRLALAASRLAGPRPAGPVTRRAFLKLVDHVGLLQLDSVNVFARAHYVPVFSRLGAYDPTLLETAAWGKKPRLFEYWGREASLLPIETQPLWRWRMADGRDPHLRRKTGLSEFYKLRKGYVDEVLAEIGRRGPVTGGDFAPEGPRKSGWWEWSEGKRALEWLFRAGFVSVKTRRGFERVYDLTERVIPAEILAAPTPTKADAQRELVRIAARSLGVFDAADLADAFSLYVADCAARAAELVEAGELEPVTVEGWRGKTWMVAGATIPRRVTGAAILNPFDPLLRNRDRTEHILGARYRIGLYTPAAEREHGYYVYPFLLGERIAARVDLKSDRKAGRLLVQETHLEPGADEAETAAALAAELRLAAAWQGLSDIAVAKKGGLATALSREFA
ncbi:MAG TPA: crosslink repair DNA glycosylase YcaQ family protein [Caulobacteraceae bacterium]|jgi:hypothetical protein